MVHGHAGEGEKQRINAITRNIHIGVHDMGTMFWWHPEMESLQKLNLVYVCGDVEEPIKPTPIRSNTLLTVALFWDRDKQLG